MGSSGRTPIAVSSCSWTGSVSYSVGRLATATGSRAVRPNRVNWLIALTQAMRSLRSGSHRLRQGDQPVRPGSAAPGVVVASRPTEYDTLPVQLQLETAIGEPPLQPPVVLDTLEQAPGWRPSPHGPG